jgi:hypothetical protein
MNLDSWDDEKFIIEIDGVRILEKSYNLKTN